MSQPAIVELQLLPLVHDASVHWVPPLHALLPAQLTSHAHDVPQLTLPAHVRVDEHVTSHRPLPHVIVPAQASVALQATRHAVAAPQEMLPAQADVLEHSTSHAMPGGHMAPSGHEPGVLQRNLQVVAFAHVPPANVHAIGHGGVTLASTTTQ